ncbi:hypothetical protein HDU92_005889 [Lobulomyces angularis]|nr:hypothetical protein HDU92_005889 [Lobulomyces angularis]
MNQIEDADLKLLVRSIKRKYFLQLSPKQIFDALTLKVIMCKRFSFWKLQENLINELLNDELYTRFPTSNYYKKQFFKQFINFIEEHKEEVHESILSTLMDNLNAIETFADIAPSFKTYQIPLRNNFFKDYDEILITIKENHNFISGGTTGLKPWVATYPMIQYFHENFTFETGTNFNVLELGSGTGLLGIYLSFLGMNVMLTDFDDSVLLRLKENTRCNEKNILSRNLKVPKVKKLNWKKTFKFSKSKVLDYLNFEKLDLIICTDVAYDDTNFNDLTDTLKVLMENGDMSSKENETKLLICSCIRKQETHKTFLEFFERKSLNVQVVEFDLNKNFIFEWFGHSIESYEKFEILKNG